MLIKQAYNAYYINVIYYKLFYLSKTRYPIKKLLSSLLKS